MLPDSVFNDEARSPRYLIAVGLGRVVSLVTGSRYPATVPPRVYVLTRGKYPDEDRLADCCYATGKTPSGFWILVMFYASRLFFNESQMLCYITVFHFCSSPVSQSSSASPPTPPPPPPPSPPPPPHHHNHHRH